MDKQRLLDFLAEKTGRGIDRIYEGSIIFGRPWPDYTDSTSRTVKLFIQNYFFG